jgi:site-specific DNA recombinase
MPPDPLPPGSQVAGYYRDSGGPDQERSVEQQQQAVRAYCELHHLALVREYADEARGGGTVAGRDAFEAMMHDLRRLAPERKRRDPEAPAGLLFWDLKRFARSEDDGAYFSADLRRRGYVLISLSDQIPAGGAAPVFEAMLRWKAQQDLADLSKDVRRGIHALIATRGPDGRYLGVRPGKVAVGFRGERVPIGMTRAGRPRLATRWVPDKGGTWEKVRRAFEMRAAGCSYREIHEALGLFGKFLPVTYHELFANRIYTGVLVYGGEVYEGWVEPCIDADLWQAVQDRQGQIAPRGQRMGSTYTLSPWLRCGECGQGRMAGSSSVRRRADGSKVRTKYYRCEYQKRGGECAGRSVPARHLERVIYGVLAADVFRPEALLDLLQDARTGQAARRGSPQAGPPRGRPAGGQAAARAVGCAPGARGGDPRVLRPGGGDSRGGRVAGRAGAAGLGSGDD